MFTSPRLIVSTFPLFLVATVIGDEPGKQSPPQGQVKQISDWALAGAVWSDASLTKKLATTAARQTESQEERAKLRKIATTATRVIEGLEDFGWRQVTRNVRADAQTPRRTRSLKRFDTETPAGQDDPGLDDERTPQAIDLDIDLDRVDDYIDETPAEARNLADAREDGVEGAIAAAAGRPAISGPRSGHISEREVETRSATMAYSKSIYDSDNYDPDVDYDINWQIDNERDIPQRLEDDEINLSNPARVVDGEDELTASMIRRNPDRLTTRPSDVSLDRFTKDRDRYPDDADWVQFQLDANQLMWEQLSESKELARSARDSMRQLRASAHVARQATSNERLSHLLNSIIEFDFE